MIDEFVNATCQGARVVNERLWPLADEWTARGPGYYGTAIGLDLLADRLNDKFVTATSLCWDSSVITDSIRIGYARGELKDLYEGGSPLLFPRFFGSYVTASDGRSGLLMSCDGVQFEPYGIFRDVAQFEDQTRSDGYIVTAIGKSFEAAQTAITDAMILAAWH